MSAVTDELSIETAQQQMTCPTCGARQIPADECRRCQCNLRMVRDVQRQFDNLRLRCEALLRERRLKRATAMAHRCREVSSDEQSARMLATCYLLQGDFGEALRVFCQTADDPAGHSKNA